jgi:hypothetical protein
MTDQAHQLMSTAKALANAGVSIAVHVGCLHEGGTDVELPSRLRELATALRGTRV